VNPPSNVKTHSVSRVALTYFILLLVSSGLSYFLFMRNPWMASDLNTDSYIWFVEFARSIFQAQSAYYAESILLPLLAKILGATKTLITYKLLCGLLTICILPITAIFAQRYFQNVFKTLFFIILFGFSFQYLQYYILGFPDPLTIILLLLAVFQKRPGAMFIFLVLAMLSHFSMAALGALGLAGMLYFSPSTKMNSIKKLAGVVIAAIVCGKVLLLAWYTVFHYQLLSRLDWALGKGYTFFLERYETDAIGFWLTPGIPLLTLYLLMTIYFLAQKKYTFVLSALVAIAMSYTALFWTVDGLRVFAVVIAAPYAYLLLSFIQSLPIWKTADPSLVTI